ncbi:hypothetical protein BpHYR1_035900 [Brachionus plicatilis]|uniref:Uncharacterized protein n=1 Tax=Brachionus plicatilis TaxID=10195 RepID=A0A3M7SHS0_BRAPC|nr:hypothetical protein BpHYR1_035900 [Brachionus plicatilis]
MSFLADFGDHSMKPNACKGWSLSKKTKIELLFIIFHIKIYHYRQLLKINFYLNKTSKSSTFNISSIYAPFNFYLDKHIFLYFFCTITHKKNVCFATKQNYYACTRVKNKFKASSERRSFAEQINNFNATHSCDSAHAHSHEHTAPNSTKAYSKP